LEEKVPRLIEETSEIVSRAVDLKDNASDEFEALGGLKKMEASAKTVHVA